jgi:hypothetical protein
MSILELLVRAKKLYLENQGKAGMCWCIRVVAYLNVNEEQQRSKGYIPYANIVSQIPEFNPEFFNAKPRRKWVQSINVGLEFWWDVECVEPRVKAFDTLIKIYENIDREFVW